MNSRCALLFCLTAMFSAALLAQGGGDPDAVYVDGSLGIEVEPTQGRLSVSDGLFQFDWEDGALEIPVEHLKTMYVSLSRRPELLVGRRKLLLSLRVEDGATAKTGRFLVAAGAGEFLSHVADVSGSRLVFESQEARDAAMVSTNP